MMKTTCAMGVFLAVGTRVALAGTVEVPPLAQAATASATPAATSRLIVTDDAGGFARRPGGSLQAHPVLGRLSARDPLERTGWLVVVEGASVIGRIVCPCVARRQRRQAEVVFDVAQNAR